MRPQAVVSQYGFINRTNISIQFK